MLAPDRNPTGAIMLEEGLAAYFSIHGPDFEYPDYRQSVIDWYNGPEVTENYRDALVAYEKLIALQPDAIVLLLKKEPHFHAMTFDLVKSVVPDADDELVRLLVSRRKMR